MTHNSKTRLRKLQEIADQLTRGKSVQNRTLKAWLGDEEYENYLADWSGQKELRADLAAKPDVVQEYEELLRQAMFFHNRAVAADARGQAAQSTLDDRATDFFEQALERLEESVHTDPSLRQWFDRDLDFSAGSELQAGAGTMPIVVTSRSADNRGGGLASIKQTKRETKLAAVERQISKLQTDDKGALGENGLLEQLLGRDLKNK